MKLDDIHIQMQVGIRIELAERIKIIIEEKKVNNAFASGCRRKNNNMLYSKFGVVLFMIGKKRQMISSK